MLKVQSPSNYFAPYAEHKVLIEKLDAQKPLVRKRHSNDSLYASSLRSPTSPSKPRKRTIGAIGHLLDRTKIFSLRLTLFKTTHDTEIQSNEDLALNYAIAQSCFTYVQERDYRLSTTDIFELSDSLTKSVKNLNSILKENYFNL